jgi:class 3 adenylate cyclase/pimeloyl-ACP methyl ester carboxylesterase
VIPETPEVRYAASSGGVQIAYEVIGDGELTIVLTLGFGQSMEMSREVPFARRWLERLTRIGRVVQMDSRGVGNSDRDLTLGAPEERMDDIVAVMDAERIDRAAIVASTNNGPIALLLAASHPDRVQSLCLYETWARSARSEDYPIGLEPQTSGVTSRARDHWGDGTTTELIIGGAADPDAARRVLARTERTTSSPAVAQRHIELAGACDVRSALPNVRAPVVVIARSDVRYTPLTVWLAEALGTTCVVLPGQWVHSWQAGYEDEVLDVIEDFLGGPHANGSAVADRVLMTVLFTDIVDSTRRAGELGDTEWRSVLERHDAVVQREVARHQGRVVKQTGDGALAVFDGPARAVRCAHAIEASMADNGLEITAGLHTGECEIRGTDVAGIAVHIASRVRDMAGPREVLATATVRDLVVGSDLRFEDRGVHTLKGLPDPWPIVAAIAPTAASGPPRTPRP